MQSELADGLCILFASASYSYETQWTLVISNLADSAILGILSGYFCGLCCI